MRSLLLSILLALTLTVCQASDNDKQLGKIVLNPYQPATAEYSTQVARILQDKLLQIATQNGMAGAGFDDRFVIAAHPVVAGRELTGTVPQKVAMKLQLTVYIGDGLDGTLYSSYTASLTGIGNTDEQAYANAVKKLSPYNADLQKSVAQGKRRIVDYYNSASGDILASARAAAKGGRYDEAITTLLAIPSSCNDYAKAQQLIEQYGKPALENANRQLLNQARTAWSTQPDDEGASRAGSYLSQIAYPSADVLAAAKALTDEMAERLKKDRDTMWKLIAQQMEYENEQQLARIESERQQNVARIESEREKSIARIIANAEVEKAYASRPKIVYHVNWW